MRYHVTVKLHADFLTVKDDLIIVGLKSKLVEGKANRELIKKLAVHFKTSAFNIHIVSGLKSKHKIVEIT